MPIAIIPQDNSRAQLQLAQIDLIGRSLGQLGQAFEARRQLAERKAGKDALVSALMGGAPADPGAAMPSPDVGPVELPGARLTAGGGLNPPMIPASAPTPTPAAAGFGGLTHDQLAALPAAALGQLFAQRFAGPSGPIEVSAGAALVDPRTGQPVYQAPAAMTSTEERLAGAGIQPGTPQAEQFLLGRPPVAPSMTYQAPPMETARDKALGEATGQRLSAISDESRNNRRIRTSIGLLDNLLEGGVSTAPGTAWRQTIRDVTGLELGDLAGADAFSAVANQLVLQAQTLQKGPQTDSDRAVIASTFPKIGTSDRANELVIDILDAQSKRLDEELAIERRLIERDGLSVSEAQSRVAQEFASKPVFDDSIIGQARDLTAGGGTPINPQAGEQGLTATNPQTGQRVIYRNGRWEAL